jgi:hypothetical protein
VEDNELIRKRLEAQFAALPGNDEGPYGDGHRILLAFLQRAPDAARAMFGRYLQQQTVGRCHTVCVTLRGAKVPWDIDVLAPLLSDARTFDWTYAVVPGQNEPRLSFRVCDVAAVTLSENHPTLKFTQAGQYADMDRQIAAIQAAVAEKKAPSGH